MGRVRDMVLRLVLSKPGLSISELALMLGVAKSSVSDAVARLEKEGLVRKVRRGAMVLVYPATRPRDEEEGATRPWGRVLRLGIIRASEYLYLPLMVKQLNMRGVYVDISVYANGSAATTDLVSGRLDAVLSPLPTQLYYYALTRGFRVVGGGVYGGSGVVLVESVAEEKAATTIASTMEVCLGLSLPGWTGERVYVSSGEEAFELVARRKVKYAVLWEPFLSRALGLNGVRLVNHCSDHVRICCTLALSRRLCDKLAEAVAGAYRRALEDYGRGRVVGLEWYSRVTGIPLAMLKRALRSYRAQPVVDVGEASTMLRRAGITMPDPWVLLREMVYE